MSQATARLDMMNDGLQTTEQLNEMVRASANEARGSYADMAAMVGKLGTLAGDSFSSSQEIVAFAEQFQKHLALSGADATQSSAAILQMTQALSSGVLRGEELNSILENAPSAAQAIARELGVSVGEMRNLAAEGQLTAKVVKRDVYKRQLARVRLLCEQRPPDGPAFCTGAEYRRGVWHPPVRPGEGCGHRGRDEDGLRPRSIYGGGGEGDL